MCAYNQDIRTVYPIVKCFLCAPLQLVLDLCRGGQLQQFLDLTGRQPHFQRCLHSNNNFFENSIQRVIVSLKTIQVESGTSDSDPGSVMSLSSLQIRFHSSRDSCSTCWSPPFSCSCTAATKRIADKEPGCNGGKRQKKI